MTYEELGLFIDIGHLEAFAENTARGLMPTCEAPVRSLAQETKKALKTIDDAHEALLLVWQGIPSMPGAVRWLLDNYYLARREGLAAAGDFARSGSMRGLSDGVMLFLLCDALVRSGLYELDAERCETFLRGFQKAIILERQELALFASGMKAALVRELARLCAEMRAGGETDKYEAPFRNIFSSLRFLSTADLRPLTERADFLEQTLRLDPAGVYPLMDERSRELYRRAVSRLAKRLKTPEYKVAQRALGLASSGSGEKAHVGWYLLREPLGVQRKLRRGGLYIGANILITLFLALLPGFASKSAVNFFLLLLPISELVKSIGDFIILRTAPPRQLPRLALSDGIPDEGRTLCVVSSVLSSPGDGTELVRRLEEYRLTNRDAGKNLLFALLADLPDTKREIFADEKEIASAAADEIARLNEKYGGGFFLLFRPRVKTPDGRYCGWERKRGAILETMRLLRGGESDVMCLSGDADELYSVRFLLTLDSDTRLAPGAARELAGAMLHPLNRPVIDERLRLVRQGHGIITPRMAVELPSATRNDFSRVFAGLGGSAPYAAPCGEVYMDIWESGGYSGKGIIDIDAYLSCMHDRLPENRVLSHDALEGAFLRGGYMGDTELTDTFPGSALSYYRRLHRWTRGDWQNAPWLFSRGRLLPDIERFRLFDSLRRSLVPVMTFAAIYVGLFTPGAGTALAAAAALLACASQLLITSAESLFRREDEIRVRYRSSLYIGVGGGLVRTFLRLVLLPVEAWFCLDAIVTALWRLLISKKNLLQWQTAGQSDKARSGLAAYYHGMWAAAPLGLLLAAFCPGIMGRAAGVIWLLSPLCSYFLSIPSRGAEELSEGDSAYLLEGARDIWKYFDDFMSLEDNFLPPDNFQSQPPAGIAHRTSPTNIGLALLSALCAASLGISDKNRAMYLIDNCLTTVERLPKWNGHLYNWYDTRTLRPLSPEYVSTVDSGNLYACLTALKNGLDEFGRKDLAERAAGLMSPMSFAPLFDPYRKLFYIGWDAVRKKHTESWYDLLSSEARLTGYVAIARGDVPRDHWRRLSRAQLQKNRFRGMASWTGTMFEYLMPELLLPVFRDSLLYESAKFCLYVQKLRTRRSGRPWGISESAYYALDPSMSFRYKAHGCAALALRRGMDDELVVSPYSTLLALSAEPRAALQNLRSLDKSGLRCKYGWWEAIDYTPSRCPRGRAGTVRCVMAHHAGMSLVAIAGCLTGGGARRWFMLEPEMSAYAGLLQEKVPVGGTVLRQRGTDAPKKPPRSVFEAWEKSGLGTDFRRPECCLLLGSLYSLMLTESGISRPLWGAVSPYRYPLSQLDHGKGLNLFLLKDGEEISLLPDMYSGEKPDCSWRFSTECATIGSVFTGFSASILTALPPDDVGELRQLTVSNTSDSALEAEVVLRFMPLLARQLDYISHPAFYRLGLSARVEDGCLIIRRLARGKTPELFICLASDVRCVFELTPGAESGRTADAVTLGREERFMVYPLISCRGEANLEPGESMVTRFALCMAHSAAAAMDSARRTLEMQEDGFADMPLTAATLIGLDSAGIESAWQKLHTLCFPPAPLPGGHYRREELWKFGISGDLPIICVEYASNDFLETARRLMDEHLLLTGCGCDCDLVFISGDGSGYHKPLNAALSDALWRSGGEALMARRGGVHIIEDGEGAEAVRHCASLLLSGGGGSAPRERSTSYRAAPVPAHDCAGHGSLRCEWGDSGAFTFYVNRSLPRRAWSNMLTNGRLGYISSDCGTGNMWYLNSRENQISPWYGDVLASSGPERLFISGKGSYFSLFASPEDTACRVTFGKGYTVWEKKHGSAIVRTTAFVPTNADARVFLIECAGLPADAELNWQLEIVMSTSLFDSRFTETSICDGVLAARNTRGMAQAKPFFALCSSGISGFTCERESALAGDLDGKCGVCAEPVFALKTPIYDCAVLVCGCESPDRLRAFADKTAARQALEATKAFWESKASVLSLETGKPALDRIMNGWIYYQAMAGRVMGRCSIYQSGGAYGFRDQLQDAVNLILFDPALAREQILRCCARQYPEGDVQHWWHEGDAAPRGVRTRCSDDLLWLAWALCEYVEKTGDRSLCFEKAGYISSPELREDEHDRYESGGESPLRESVLRHCARALDAAVRRGEGGHGLLRFGSGDWNDGFDGVLGESQWLTWFFCITARRFAALSDGIEPGSGEKYAAAAEKYVSAANEAWDGQWFLRGYYADGAPLGSSKSKECRIDSVAQSFAAMCPGADDEKVDSALDSAFERLFDREAGLVRLFDPPFSGAEHPGYIESYGPGFRENGGQYTHGALWLIMAFFRRGRADEAYAMLEALLPAGKDPEKYHAEPFVIAADVYSAPGHEGEAGWSWYTGSAGWLLRIVTEEMLGLRLRDGRLFVEPRLPSAIDGYEAECLGHEISVGKDGISVDGRPYDPAGLDIYRQDNS